MLEKQCGRPMLWCRQGVTFVQKERLEFSTLTLIIKHGIILVLVELYPGMGEPIKPPTSPNLIKEAGSEHVHPVTRRVGAISQSNSSRDIFRFVKLPLDVSYVTCDVCNALGERETKKLPMFDPHELLDYGWRTGRFAISDDELKSLVLQALHFLFFSLAGSLHDDLRGVPPVLSSSMPRA